jgi:hypothetical protein
MIIKALDTHMCIVIFFKVSTKCSATALKKEQHRHFICYIRLMEYASEGVDAYRGGICIIFTFVCYCSNASIASYIFSTELLFVMKI